jgi:hypothetical protein
MKLVLGEIVDKVGLPDACSVETAAIAALCAVSPVGVVSAESLCEAAAAGYKALCDMVGGQPSYDDIEDSMSASACSACDSNIREAMPLPHDNDSNHSQIGPLLNSSFISNFSVTARGSMNTPTHGQIVVDVSLNKTRIETSYAGCTLTEYTFYSDAENGNQRWLVQDGPKCLKTRSINASCTKIQLPSNATLVPYWGWLQSASKVNESMATDCETWVLDTKRACIAHSEEASPSCRLPLYFEPDGPVKVHNKNLTLQYQYTESTCSVTSDLFVLPASCSP